MAVVQSEGSLLNAAPPWSPRFGIGSIAHPSGLVQDYAAIYRTQPNVRLVVNFLARNIASLEIRPYRRVDDVTVEPLERTHPLSRVLRKPNPRTTRHRYVLALMHDLGIFDRFYSLKARNPESNALRTFRIPPQNLRPKDDGSWLFVETFETVGIRDRREYAAETVIYIHGHDPEDPRSGLSPIESIRRILIEDQAASDYRAQFWANGARISGVIERPLEAPKWSPVARSRFREELHADYANSGPQAGGIPILEEGMVWKDASFSAKDAEYLDARRLSREEVAAAYHVSPLFVGILDHANFSNVAEQHKHLYADTLGPWLDMVEEDFELQLLPEFPDLNPEEIELRFNLEEKLRGSFEEEATILQTATGAPWMTRNEARGRRGMAPLPGGDDLVVPLNVLVGGQASPRDSAPPLGLAGRGPGNPVPPARARKAAELETKLVEPTGAKAVDDLPSDVQGWHAKHEEVLVPFFTRQGSSVRARYGASGTIDDAFDAARWDRELEADLAALAFSMTEELGTAVAERLGGTFDLSVAEAWLRENARIAAEKVNATTLATLIDELAALEADDADPELTDSDVLDSVFTVAAGARAAELALTRTTSVSSFARQEAAAQTGMGTKTWRVNSTRSRHPELNGETVPIGETFSNGLLWPGDPSGPAEETAGCTCSIEFEA